MGKKKIVIVAAVIVLVIAAAGGGAWYLLGSGKVGAGNGDKVYVEQVSSLMNGGSGAQNRYSGVVEPQKSWDVNKDGEKTVKEVFVKEGDTVEVGTPLFSYDTDEIQDQIATAKLELEGIDNEISDYYNQIETLKSERAAASEDMKFQYTTEIQSVETSIKQSQYNKESKGVEIARMEESLNNATVTSEIAGIIKSISENGSDPYTGEELPYMTVLAVGDYRVKGTINEQNIYAVSPETPVIIRSRIDETQTWAGKITEVDTQNQIQNNNNYYDGGGGETASKYPFYIELDSVDGLILGQHVLIEMDEGQTETKEGVWLYESYIVKEGDTGGYVWAEDNRKRLEKRSVELGEYDAELGMYQIISGVTEDDYIAFPMEALYEGVPAVRDASEVDYESPMYSEEGGMQDGGDTSETDILPEGGDMQEDGMLPEGEGMQDGNMLPEGEGMQDGNMLPEGGELPESGDIESQDAGDGLETEPEVAE
ncbi:MAG: biotin/lipoyl-binding protein [Lachnospiraceae bacterium]|nr:biotin/lipoyl-binding protein [Lachnospiraceae bacterium]